MLQTKNSMRSVSVINPVTVENTGDKQPQGSHIVLLPCIVSEKNWNTKEDKDKFMMRVLYVLWLVKRHILGQSDVVQ